MKYLMIIFMIFIPFGLQARTAFRLYHVDRQIFERYPSLSEPYLSLQQTFDKGQLTQAEHQRRIVVLRSLLKKEAHWIDGYWLLSAEAYMLASSFDTPKVYPKALELLQDAENSSELCLQRVPKQVLCKFFLASVLAKKSSIEGIVSSLRGGFKIYRLWSEVLHSNYEVWFRPNASLQGSVRYALGIFYRLVPDRWWVERLFGIRGSLEQSIQIHREGLGLNPDDPCAQMMLGTSLTCKGFKTQDTEVLLEGQDWLDRAQKTPAYDLNQRLCQRDVTRLVKEPSLSCGYTQAKPVAGLKSKKALLNV